MMNKRTYIFLCLTLIMIALAFLVTTGMAADLTDLAVANLVWSG